MKRCWLFTSLILFLILCLVSCFSEPQRKRVSVEKSYRDVNVYINYQAGTRALDFSSSIYFYPDVESAYWVIIGKTGRATTIEETFYSEKFILEDLEYGEWYFVLFGYDEGGMCIYESDTVTINVRNPQSADSDESIPISEYYLIGPAGGYVFYDCDADNEDGNEDGLESSVTGWRFLEACPYELSEIGEDGEVNKLFTIGEATTALETFSWGGFSDWNIPTIQELQLLANNIVAKGYGDYPNSYIGKIVNRDKTYSVSDEALTSFGTNHTNDYGYVIPIRRFLPSENIHVLSKHSAVAVTCQTDGCKEYWECIDCGKCFSTLTDLVNNEVTAEEMIIEHDDTCNHAFVTIPEVFPTHTEQGRKEGKICKLCEHEEGFEPTPCVPDDQYAIGDTGPGGGIVFYASETTQTDSYLRYNEDSGEYEEVEYQWRYLEAGTPIERTQYGFIISALEDSNLLWGYFKTSTSSGSLFTNLTKTYSSEDCTNSEVGKGRMNTSMLMKLINDDTVIKDYGTWQGEFCDIFAVQACVEYSSGTDWDGCEWFMPSEEEVKLLLRNIVMEDSDGNAYTSFASSTESPYSPVYYVAVKKSANTVTSFYDKRLHPQTIVPVRAF